MRLTTGTADADLDQRLSDELDRVNAAATPGLAPAQELTVRVTAATASSWPASPAGPGASPPASG